MHLPNFKKKFVGAALAAGMVMGAGGAAFAYFSAHATAKGDADVGTFTGTLKVTHTNTGPNETPLFPGHSVRQVFVVSNTGTTPIKITAVTANLTKSPTGKYIITDTSMTPVTGCLASWFSLTVTTTTGSTTVMGMTLSGTHNQAVIVTMHTTGTQNACMGKQPLFTLTIRGTNA